MPQLKNFYIGFSTANYEEKGGSFELHNVSVIEEDILREIHTELGTRSYMPTWGTRIPILPFEINDTNTEDVLREDLQKVISHEPRVELMNLDILRAREKNALIAVLKLNFLEFAVTKDLYIEVNSR